MTSAVSAARLKMGFYLVVMFIFSLTAVQCQTQTKTKTTTTTTFTATLKAYFQQITTIETQTDIISLPPVVPASTGHAAEIQISIVDIDIYNKTSVLQHFILPLACGLLNLKTTEALAQSDIDIVVINSNGYPIEFNVSSLVESNTALTQEISLVVKYLNTTKQLTLPFGQTCNPCSGKKLILNFLQLIVTMTKVSSPVVDIHSSNQRIIQAVIQVFVEINEKQWLQFLTQVVATNVNNTSWLGHLGQYFLAILLAIVKNSLPPNVIAPTLPIPPTSHWAFSTKRPLPTPKHNKKPTPKPKPKPTSKPKPKPTSKPKPKPTLRPKPSPWHLPSSGLQQVSGNILQTIPHAIFSVPGGIGSIFENVVQDFPKVLNGLTSGAIGHLDSSLKVIITVIIKFVIQLVTEIVQLPRTAIISIQQLIIGVGTAIKNVITFLVNSPVFNIKTIFIAIAQFISEIVQKIVNLPKETFVTVEHLSSGVGGSVGQIISGFAHTSGLTLPTNFGNLLSGGKANFNYRLLANVSTLSANNVLPCIVESIKKAP